MAPTRRRIEHTALGAVTAPSSGADRLSQESVHRRRLPAMSLNERAERGDLRRRSDSVGSSRCSCERHSLAPENLRGIAFMIVARNAGDLRRVAHEFARCLAQWLEARHALALNDECDEHTTGVTVAYLSQIDRSEPAISGAIFRGDARFADLGGADMGA